MTTVSPPPVKSQAELNGHAALAPAPVAPEWGNSAPLALIAFGVTTFMLSMVNANAINAGVAPVVFGVALFFGGLAQLLGGLVQLRVGKTFTGVLFTGFGAFWMSLFAYVQWFAKAVPAAQAGHAMGLLLYAFGIFAAIMFLVSFRTNVVVVAALAVLTATLFILGVGNYGAHTNVVHWGGYLGILVAAMAFYLATSELAEEVYERPVLPVWPLS
ncbi:MAG: acetate uptake transporter [Solirubrobacteraceae bacterium]|jgi:uncharacterized protein